jgi:hypothetical protein
MGGRVVRHEQDRELVEEGIPQYAFGHVETFAALLVELLNLALD